jgi:serine/threonine protein kinase
MMELAPGDPETIGPYGLHARIGSGGMGVVYLASDSSGREAALKLVREELAADAGFRARFAREVRRAALTPGFGRPVISYLRQRQTNELTGVVHIERLHPGYLGTSPALK